MAASQKSKDILQIKLQHKRTTKGTEMYATDASGAFVTNLYIQKEAFNGTEKPSEITVTVSALA